MTGHFCSLQRRSRRERRAVRSLLPANGEDVGEASTGLDCRCRLRRRWRVRIQNGKRVQLERKEQSLQGIRGKLFLRHTTRRGTYNKIGLIHRACVSLIINLFNNLQIYYNELETRVRLSRRRQKIGLHSNSTSLIIRHRPLNASEIQMQRYREKQLEPPRDDDDDEDENEDE